GRPRAAVPCGYGLAGVPRPGWTSKCTWGAVKRALPVWPLMAISSPALTRCPTVELDRTQWCEEYCLPALASDADQPARLDPLPHGGAVPHEVGVVVLVAVGALQVQADAAQRAGGLSADDPVDDGRHLFAQGVHDVGPLVGPAAGAGGPPGVDERERLGHRAGLPAPVDQVGLVEPGQLVGDVLGLLGGAGQLGPGLLGPPRPLVHGAHGRLPC